MVVTPGEQTAQYYVFRSYCAAGVVHLPGLDQASLRDILQR
jgi:hypothetical protein